MTRAGEDFTGFAVHTQCGYLHHLKLLFSFAQKLYMTPPICVDVLRQG